MNEAEQQFWDLCQFPLSEEAPLIMEQDLQQAVIEESDHFLVLNKPGWMVCHPSKNGPWSSLVGAVREWKQWDKMHLVARLDRETSGVVVIARHRLAARTVQMAIERREVDKQYLAILRGEMKHPYAVYLPIGPDRDSPIVIRQKAWYDRTTQEATTHFHPLYSGNGYTLAKVDLVTGRKHQIRVHAEAIGYPVLGDKIYGRQDTLYLDFIEKGVLPEMKQSLGFPRQALHCHSMELDWKESRLRWVAPIPEEFRLFQQIFWPEAQSLFDHLS
jgi:23S rRNA pseudouridine1911/1915/1917 synthase